MFTAVNIKTIMCNLVDLQPPSSELKQQTKQGNGSFTQGRDGHGQRYKQANGKHVPEKALPSTFSCSTPKAISLNLRVSSPLHATLSLSTPVRKLALFQSP